MSIYCSDKPIRGESSGRSVPYERPDRSKHGGFDVASDKPIRGGSAGRSVPYEPTQRSWFRSFFRPDQRTVRKITQRPESTTIEYGDDKTLENISPYGTEMTYDPGTLRPQKEVINMENKMPAVPAGDPGYVKEVRYYPQEPKKETIVYGGKRQVEMPTGFTWYPSKETRFPTKKPINTNPGLWTRLMNWWNSR